MPSPVIINPPPLCPRGFHGQEWTSVGRRQPRPSCACPAAIRKAHDTRRFRWRGNSCSQEFSAATGTAGAWLPG
jgi:hypothetical protein